MTALFLHYLKMVVLFLLIGGLVIFSRLGGREQNSARTGGGARKSTPA